MSAKRIGILRIEGKGTVDIRPCRIQLVHPAPERCPQHQSIAAGRVAR